MFKKRTLEDKIRLRIKLSEKNIFIPNDFADLSDRRQVSRVIKKMVDNGEIARLAYGIFAKTKTLDSGDRILIKSFPALAREALLALGLEVKETIAEREFKAGTSTQIPTGLTVGVNKMISRSISYAGRSIRYERL